MQFKSRSIPVAQAATVILGPDSSSRVKVSRDDQTSRSTSPHTVLKPQNMPNNCSSHPRECLVCAYSVSASFALPHVLIWAGLSCTHETISAALVGHHFKRFSILFKRTEQHRKQSNFSAVCGSHVY